MPNMTAVFSFVDHGIHTPRGMCLTAHGIDASIRPSTFGHLLESMS